MNIFCPATAKWQLFQISAKFNRNDFSMANILKLQKYKAIGLMKMHNMNNIWFAINKFSLWKNWFRINGPFTIVFFNFCLFHFFKFQMTVVKNLMKKPSFFIMDFEGSYEVLLCHKYIWFKKFWQWNDDRIKNFWNFHGNAFCFFIFSKWKLYYKLTINDTFKMYCCAWC